MPVALVSDPVAHTLDEDLAPLREALAALGIPSEIAFWDNDSVDWAGFGLVVVRSPWDYFRRRGAFLSRAERTAAVTRLANPAGILRWNTDKRWPRRVRSMQGQPRWQGSQTGPLREIIAACA